MTSNLLEVPVLEIQRKLKRKLPWGYVASCLVSLLGKYSTGLTPAVACDEILARYQAQLQRVELPSHYRAVVIRISPEPPEIWLVRLTDGRHIAFFPHSKLLARFNPGFSLYFPAEVVTNSYNHDIKAEAIALAEKALVSAPRSFGNCIERKNAQSPVDVAKFNCDPNKYGEALSKTVFPLPSITATVLPTPTVLIDLDSLPANALNITEPIETYTLQRVWDERSLAPNYIFARVVEVHNGKHIRIQDQSPDVPSAQPSVLWLLHENQYSYADILNDGCYVLLERPAVQPNGNSFFVIANECTTCFFRTLSSVIKTNPQSLEVGTIIVPESPPRKRQRRDPDLSQSLTVVESHALIQLLEPHLQREFVMFSTAMARPTIESPNLAEIQCFGNLGIRIVGAEMVTRCHSVFPGDQLLFEGVRWVAASSTLGSQTSAGWAASSFHNISAIFSVLQSPLFQSSSTS